MQRADDLDLRRRELAQQRRVTLAGHVRELVDAGFERHPRAARLAHVRGHAQVVLVGLRHDRSQRGQRYNREAELKRDLDHGGTSICERAHVGACVVRAAHDVADLVAVHGNRIAARRGDQRPRREHPRLTRLRRRWRKRGVGRTDVAHGRDEGEQLALTQRVHVQVDDAREQRRVLELERPRRVDVDVVPATRPRPLSHRESRPRRRGSAARRRRVAAR